MQKLTLCKLKNTISTAHITHFKAVDTKTKPQLMPLSFGE